ncbi:MAG: sulfite exporter TauE/SafE family protein, partial [Gammaproteobacteria bacterium]
METLLIYAATGVAAGLLAGLFGVGGGLIMVPALALVLSWQGIGPAVVMQVAVATSLAVISATSVSSMLAHHRRQGVLWPVFLRFAPGLALGAVAGAFVAHALPGAVLQRIVGVGAILVALHMFLDGKKGDASLSPPAASEAGKSLASPFLLVSAGGFIGLLSALIGIGGGSLTVPFLSWRGVPIQQAVGTSAACGVPIAWAGAAGFVVAGWAVAGLPPFSLGYVALPAFA